MIKKYSEVDRPSIDKPWLQYYGEDRVHFNKHKSLYQCFREKANKQGSQLIYIEQRTGLKLTYSELLFKIDCLAVAMKKKGVSNGSRVGLLCFYSDFEPFVILAANKIGALVKMVSLDLTVKELRDSIAELDMLFVDGFFKDLEEVIRSTGVSTVWNKNELTTWNEGYYHFSDMVSDKYDEPVNEYKFAENEPAMIIYSSGTTGVAKPIVHTNASVLSAVEKMLNSDFPIDSNNYILRAIPSHIGLGCITTLLTSLLGGCTCITIKPQEGGAELFETFNMVKNYRQFIYDNELDAQKGLLMFASPVFAMIIYKNIDEFTDLSYMTGILLAGAKMGKDMLDEMSQALSAKGLSVPLCNGYGQNEMCGAITLNTVHHNKNGSAGYPVKDIEIRVIDSKTKLEKAYNEEGLIIERSNSLFLYYDKMPEKTEASKIVLPDGTTWFNTTDLGYIDTDGFIHVTGRTTRSIVRMDHKLSLDYLEEKLRAIDVISDAAVIAIAEEEKVVAYVSLNNVDRANEIEELVKSSGNFTMWDLPDKIIVLDSLPYMKNGKADYRAIEKKAQLLN